MEGQGTLQIEFPMPDGEIEDGESQAGMGRI